MPKSARSATAKITGPITTIQTPLESSRAVGVHWLCHLPNFRFQNGRKCPELPDRPPPKSCPGLHSAITGPIIPIQTPLECSRAVGVHWLCHLSDFRFQNGRKCPNLGKCGIFWASLLLTLRSLTACLPLHRHSTSLPLRSVTHAHRSNWAPLGPTFCFRPLGIGHCLVLQGFELESSPLLNTFNQGPLYIWCARFGYP